MPHEDLIAQYVLLYVWPEHCMLVFLPINDIWKSLARKTKTYCSQPYTTAITERLDGLMNSLRVDPTDLRF